MLRHLLLYAIALLFMASNHSAQQRTKWAIAVHGGAGSAEWEHMDVATAAEYRTSMTRALSAGTAKLKAGASAIDAVEAAIVVLENDSLFNAGRGAAFNADGKNEMDASIMEGTTLQAGAVAGVRSTKNPISLARAVMQGTPHVMLIGAGADAFAARAGLPQMPPSYLFTERRWQEFVALMMKSGRPVPARPVPIPASSE
jgi:L-asparaginase / beta-aspartyl-peptidase